MRDNRYIDCWGMSGPRRDREGLCLALPSTKELARNASVHCDSNDVALVVNVDGLPIYKPSSKEILANFMLVQSV